MFISAISVIRSSSGISVMRVYEYIKGILHLQHIVPNCRFLAVHKGSMEWKMNCNISLVSIHHNEKEDVQIRYQAIISERTFSPNPITHFLYSNYTYTGFQLKLPFSLMKHSIRPRKCYIVSFSSKELVSMDKKSSQQWRFGTWLYSLSPCQ